MVSDMGDSTAEVLAEDVPAPVNGAVYGVPTEDQLAKINRLARRKLAADEVFVFSAKFVGNGRIDSRYMKLDTSLLKNFVADAERGIAFMLDHSWAGRSSNLALTYGRTFESSLQPSEGPGDETHAQFGSIYIARSDDPKQGISANQIIHDIETGTLFDLSAGFSFRVAECSICGNDIRDLRACKHLPGLEYDGNICYVVAKPPGNLFEVSGVFAGAYNTAGILAATGAETDLPYEEMGDADDIKRVQPGELLTCTYSYERGLLVARAKRDAIRKTVLVGVDHDVRGGGKGMADENLGQQADAVDAALQAEEEKVASDEEAVLVSEAGDDETRAYLSVPVAKVAEALGDAGFGVETVLQYAKEGLQYRKELVESALEWGVRAHGNDFARSSWEQVLTEPTRTIEALKGFIEQFQREAQRQLSSGRTSAPDADDAPAAHHPSKPVEQPIPDEAFKS